MRTALGLILVLIGAAVMIYGIGSAVLELLSLYQGALSDPLNQSETVEQDTSRAMIRSAIIGALGIPPFLIGAILLKITLLQRLRRRPR